MGRTGEMLFTFLGIVVYSFYSVIGGATIWMNNNQDKVEGLLDEESANQVDVTKEEFLQMLEDMGGAGWYILIGTILAIIGGCIAIYFLRKNKNPKAAGIILLASSVVSILVTFLFAWPAALIYVVAGIMALVRKI